MEQKRTELHEIDDIRAVFEVRVTKEVNRRGEAISRGSVHHDTEHPAGWECLVCDVKFQRWPAVAAHLQTPRPARQRQPAKIVTLDQVEEIKVFARETLGVELTAPQTEVMAAILKGHSIVLLSRNTGQKVHRRLMVAMFAHQRKLFDKAVARLEGDNDAS